MSKIGNFEAAGCRLQVAGMFGGFGLRNRKGEMVVNNAIGLILAIAVVFLLVYFMVNLFSPSFDESSEIAESYLKSFERAVEEADDMGKGSFFMLDLGDDERKFYLVDFGEAFDFSYDGKEFVRSPRKDNVCICYWQDERVLCRDCLELEVNYLEGKRYKIVPWVVEEGVRIEVNKGKGVYELVKS